MSERHGASRRFWTPPAASAVPLIIRIFRLDNALATVSKTTVTTVASAIPLTRKRDADSSAGPKTSPHQRQAQLQALDDEGRLAGGKLRQTTGAGRFRRQLGQVHVQLVGRSQRPRPDDQ